MNSQIVDEAAQWFVTLRDGGADPAHSALFSEWLLKSPEHVRTYLELTPIWAESASIDSNRPFDANALIARARADSNVIELEKPVAVAAASRAPAKVRIVRRHWIAAALAALGVAAILNWAFTRSPIYTTGIGEQRSIALPDGSHIQLNADSRLQVKFSRGERTIDLLEGQGLFKVAKDPQRPFIVRSGDTHVRAIGTQFDVYRKSIGTIVTVVEGKVEIGTAPIVATAPPASGAKPANAGLLRLAAGEQATIAAHKIARARRPNIEAATAWTQNQLVFDAAALIDVAAEFNRYNFKRLVIRDARLDAFPISGVFSSSESASLVQFLMEQPEIAVEQTATQVIISQKIR